MSNRLWELGAQGVWESSGYLSAYITEMEPGISDALNEYLASLQELFPRCHLGWEKLAVPKIDWVENWKRYYYPQPLSQRLYLLPIWERETAIPRGMQAILMQPGQAFGTGLHPSTQLCVKHLERLISMDHPVSVLDVGTGSGILSIAAKLLGARRVSAIDTDEMAIQIASQNADRNKCAIELFHGSLEKVLGEYDIIVANILLGVHKHLGSHYRRLLFPTGILILSGLLASEGDELQSWIAGLGMQVISSLQDQGWLAISVSHKIAS